MKLYITIYRPNGYRPVIRTHGNMARWISNAIHFRQKLISLLISVIFIGCNHVLALSSNAEFLYITGYRAIKAVKL